MPLKTRSKMMSPLAKTKTLTRTSANSKKLACSDPTISGASPVALVAGSKPLGSLCGRFGCRMSVNDGMQCGSCKRWYHAPCTNLNAENYKLLEGMPSVPWACTACSVGVDDAAGILRQ